MAQVPQTAGWDGDGSQDGGSGPFGRRVLAVVAHPDDESFGLGGIIGRLTAAGVEVTVLCFTHGEASTLGAVAGDLGTVRAAEMEAAAVVLGVARTELLAYPDGSLSDQPAEELQGHVARLASSLPADTLLVFDGGGITGHPDHVAATSAALAAADELGAAAVAWVLPSRVADALNARFGTDFRGREADEVHVVLAADRHRQRQAIECHRSQSIDNPVVWTRLDLQGDEEQLRWLRRAPRPTDGSRPGVTGQSTPAISGDRERTGSSGDIRP